jgi:hypothetical protein
VKDNGKDVDEISMQWVRTRPGYPLLYCEEQPAHLSLIEIEAGEIQVKVK